MATIEASQTSSCPTVEGSADVHNQTIDNTTDFISSRGSSGWAALFKDPFEACLVCVQFLLCLTIYVGNSLTLSAMSFDKKLKKNMQNKYIMSLAAADQVTGLNLLQLLLKNYSEADGAWLSDIAVNISIFQPIVDFLARLRSVVCYCFLSDRLTYHDIAVNISIFQPIVDFLARLRSVVCYCFLSDRLTYHCQPNLVLLYTASAVSLMNMLTIAVDRYFYIVHPFMHMRHVTPRKISVLLIVQWMVAGLYGIVPIYVFNSDESKGCNPFYLLHRRFVAFSHPILFFIDCFGIGVTYGLIAKVARQQFNRKNKRAQQIKAVIVNCTTKRNKSVDSSSTATEIEQHVVDGDIARIKHTKHKYEYGEDVQPAVVTMSSTNEEEKVYEASYDSLAPDGINQRIENKINIDRNDAESLYINENVNVLTNVAQNKCAISNVEENEVNSVTIIEVVVFPTDNTVASTVNKHSLDKKHSALSNQEGILISDTTIKENCNKSGKEITGSSDDKNSKIFSDSNVNTITQSSDNSHGKRRPNMDDHTTTEINRNTNESETYHDTSDKTLTVNTNSVESGANIDTSNHTLTVNSGCAKSADGTLVKSDNKTIENIDNKSQVKHPPHPPEVQRCQTSQQVSTWSLASLRWMKQMIVVFGLFFLCWTPSMVCILISAVREPDHKVVYVLGMFGVANSAVNVFVYSICNKAYSEAIKKVCCRCRKRN